MKSREQNVIIIKKTRRKQTKKYKNKFKKRSEGVSAHYTVGHGQMSGQA